MQRVNLNLNFLHLLGGRAVTSCESLGLLLPQRVGCVVSRASVRPTPHRLPLAGRPRVGSLSSQISSASLIKRAKEQSDCWQNCDTCVNLWHGTSTQ